MLIACWLSSLSPSLGEDNPVRFVDVTQTSGIRFFHQSSPDKKYILESISGGVALLDYDNDGWLDIYFLNSLTVDTADEPRSAKSLLYRNNRDGTFTDVTDATGVGYPGWGVGTCVGDYDANVGLFIGPGLLEQLDDFGVAVLFCKHQGRPAIVALFLHIGSCSQ